MRKFETQRKMSSDPSVRRNQKNDGPSGRCHLLQSITDRACWLKRVPSIDVKLIKSVLDDFQTHLDSGCFCSSRSANYLAMAITEMELFTAMFKISARFLNEEETELKRKSDEIAEKKRNSINDVEINEESHFTSNYNKYISTANFKYLLDSLFEALEMFKKAFNADSKESILKSTLLNRLEILGNLNTLFQMFLYYGMEMQAFRTIDLAWWIVKKYYKPQDDSEDIVMIKCNMLKLLLRLGFIDTSRSLYGKLFGHHEFEEIQKIDSFENAMIFLIYCEILLRSKNGKRVGEKLKIFLQSDYLKKNTIKRYLLKAMANALASRFPSSLYEFEPYFNEFCDPIQMSVGVCRRWKFFNLFFSNNLQIENNDPLVYRFATFNLFAETFEDFMHFHMNNGMTTDPVFYYKLAINLYATTLNILGLAFLQLIGANYDVQNGHLIDAKFKMILFQRYFQSESQLNLEIFESENEKFSSIQTTTSSQNDRSNNDSEMIDSNFLNNDNEEDGEDDDSRPKSIFQCYKKLIIDARSGLSSNSFGNDYDDSPNPFTVLSEKSSFIKFLKDLEEKSFTEDFILNVFELYIRFIITSIMLKSEQSSLMITLTKSKYLLLLDSIEKFVLKIRLPIFAKYFTESLWKITPKSNMIEQIINCSIGSLFWLWSEFFIKSSINSDRSSEIYLLIEKLTQISTYSYQNRIYRARMFYYHALISYRNLRQNHRNESTSISTNHKIFKLFTHLLNDEIPSDKQSKQQVSTPSPSVLKSSRKNFIEKFNPKAPTKSGFVSETIREYGQSLLDRISSQPHSRRNVLNFEDESDAFVETETIDQQQSSKQNPDTESKRNTKKKIRKKLIILDDDDDDDSEDASQSLDKPFTIYSESMIVKSLSQLLESMSILNKENEADDDDKTLISSITKWFEPFRLNSAKNISDAINSDENEIKQSIKKIVCYVGGHPGHKLYSDLQLLSYKFSKFTNKSDQLLLYHFAETASYNAFRYRLLFNSFKKMNKSKMIHYDVEIMSFNNEDYRFQNYYHDLPKQWRFVQLKVLQKNDCPLPDLLICWFQNGFKPFFIRIKHDPTKVTKFFLNEFDDIMRINSVSVTETSKKIFWKMRHELDERLCSLLESTERNYFALIKGLFIGKIQDKKYQSACAWFKKKFMELVQKESLECRNSQFFDLIIQSIVLLEDEEIRFAVKILFETENSELLQQSIKLKTKYFRPWSTDKSALLELFRLAQPVGLIIDPILNQFPFESMPTFRKINQPFFRMPSLRVAALLCKRYSSLIEKGMIDDKTFYLLNPGNNLENTEKSFKNHFLSIKEWSGFVGKAPDGPILEQKLENENIYIYMGHGSGSQYYRSLPNGFDAIDLQALSIIAGCSSGRVTNQTKCSDTFGAAYRFLVNGAPTYIGPLWDVTDKDIDIYFNHFMSTWFPKWNAIPNKKKNSSLCQSVSEARNYCKLRHLIGCAPVVYGLPIQIGGG
ncbi:Separin [Sarcoptes scabiei]|uniref:separase n=1 Tax=Sarcoptes scabiei TaxID=52283 RepID=A0A834VAJ2_SARSC|nr:Separin [Sarcoptes scabiei]